MIRPFLVAAVGFLSVTMVILVLRGWRSTKDLFVVLSTGVALGAIGGAPEGPAHSFFLATLVGGGFSIGVWLEGRRGVEDEDRQDRPRQATERERRASDLVQRSILVIVLTAIVPVILWHRISAGGRIALFAIYGGLLMVAFLVLVVIVVRVRRRL